MVVVVVNVRMERYSGLKTLLQPSGQRIEVAAGDSKQCGVGFVCDI